MTAAVLAGSGLAAQTAPAPARSVDGRDVTAVGCLKQERDVHGRLTTGSEAAGPGDAFVLTNARITSASLPEAPTAAARERERQTSPSGAPGVSGAGTSGTENTSVQSTDRPASQTPGGATAANPPARSPETIYKLVGLPDSELTPLLGKHVEVRATLDANTMGSAALRQPGMTMGREPANTPSASTPPPSPAQAPPTEAAADRQDARPAPAALPELKATSIKATGGRCQGT